LVLVVVVVVVAVVMVMLFLLLLLRIVLTKPVLLLQPHFLPWTPHVPTPRQPTR
jgi:hypothetical protein